MVLFKNINKSLYYDYSFNENMYHPIIPEPSICSLEAMILFSHGPRPTLKITVVLFSTPVCFFSSLRNLLMKSFDGLLGRFFLQYFIIL